jgi:hypothetical protein
MAELLPVAYSTPRAATRSEEAAMCGPAPKRLSGDPRNHRDQPAVKAVVSCSAAKGFQMADTRTLTNREDIRDWAAARMGAPAIVDVSAESGTQPLLRLVFDQAAYQDQDQAERPANAGGYEIVEWDEWFKLFDEQSLALIVGNEQPGVRESSHRIVKREG